MKLNFPAAAAIAAILSARCATAAIIVESRLTSVSGLEDLRAQAVITESTSFGRDGDRATTAVAIKEITTSILFRDDSISNGIAVQKSNLTAAQAYGLGLPFGNTSPPTTDPEGPWHGLVWPYRDQYDYFPDQFDPLGDDVGIPFSDQPGVYGFVNIAGISRGGPTDPEPAGGDPNRLQRGLDGNGLTGPASYFLFDITPLAGPLDREVKVTIFGASCIVVQRDNQTGAYSEIQVQIPDFTTTIHLPEPACAAALLLVSAAALTRRRRLFA